MLTAGARAASTARIGWHEAARCRVGDIVANALTPSIESTTGARRTGWSGAPRGGGPAEGNPRHTTMQPAD